MPNDFEPHLGKRFKLRRVSDQWSGVVECELLELVAPHRMVWSWFMGDEPNGIPSRVVFELRVEGSATLLTLTHVGDAADPTGALVRDRWPLRLADMHLLLRNRKALLS